MKCTALMVAIDHSHNDIEVYYPIEMNVLDGIMPENNARDISAMVQICNENTAYEDTTFIDMYGIVVDGKEDVWEVLDEL